MRIAKEEMIVLILSRGSSSNSACDSGSFGGGNGDNVDDSLS